LNYKGVTYDTKWVDFPDIEPTLRQYGVEPYQAVALGAAVGARYTLPAIQLPNGCCIMDSSRIAIELEKTYPNPPLKSDSELFDQAQDILRRVAWPLYPEIAVPIRDNLLTEYGKPHWVEAREKLFGMSIDEVHRTKGGQGAWDAAQAGLDRLDHLMSTHKEDDGPFLLGSSASTADFVIVAFLAAAKAAGPEIFEQLLRQRQGFTALWDACQTWLERDR
jgi:glutathione S-transferase